MTKLLSQRSPLSIVYGCQGSYPFSTFPIWPTASCFGSGLMFAESSHLQCLSITLKAQLILFLVANPLSYANIIFSLLVSFCQLTDISCTHSTPNKSSKPIMMIMGDQKFELCLGHWKLQICFRLLILICLDMPLPVMVAERVMSTLNLALWYVSLPC